MLEFIQAYGAYIQFFVQVAFWIVLMVVSIWAVVLFSRLVNAKIATYERAEGPTPGSTAAPGATSATREDVKVDEFVD